MAAVSPPITSGYTSGRGGFRDLDWVMLLLVVALSIWGCATIMSASRPALEATAASADQAERLSDGLKQGVWIVVGLAAMTALALSNYQWLMHLQFGLYTLNLAMLVLVLIIGREVNGATSWIRFGPFALQPAELSKFAIIVCLAAFLCRRQERIREFSTLMWSLVYIGVPLLLIMKQPDFGTTLAILAIWFGMAFFGGARLSHLALIVGVGVLLFGVAWQKGVLKPHQKERLSVFLNTDPSPRGAGYQIKQSQIAIGSGQISGQGWGQGMQNRSKHVPENTTDFIFTVVAEELGFIGGGLLLLAYLVLLLRSATVAVSTENFFGVLIAGGFTSLLAFHCIINLGMTMRLMPITGVPLPFFSYGGSSYIAFSMCVGLLQSIAMRRKRSSGI